MTNNNAYTQLTTKKWEEGEEEEENKKKNTWTAKRRTHKKELQVVIGVCSLASGMVHHEILHGKRQNLIEYLRADQCASIFFLILR